MRKTCDICSGGGRVTLPVRRPTRAYSESDADVPMAAERNYREYDCPECSKPVTAEVGFVKVITATEVYEAEYEVHPGFIENLVGHLAYSIADKARSEGVVSVEFSKGQGPLYHDPKVATATVGFVSPSFVASIEQRAAAKASEMLDGVAEDAAKSISVWGSEYSDNSGAISKSMAMRFVRQAFADRIEQISESLKNG